MKFQRKATEAGLNTQKSGFARGNVLLQASHKNCDALAVIAELSLIEVHHTSAETCSSAQSNVESTITALKSRAITAENSQESHEATQCMVDFSALQSAWGWQSESKADKLKAVEALKTWLGSKQSSRQVDTSALCAALTDDLKLITLSQSKTFLSFDTICQMACASAISVTITESTAASLISFTADTLRSKAIDKRGGVLNMRTDSHSQANGMDTGPRANHHPTVKPTALMRYLCRLVTPPSGTVLDPFTGSGSTGKAAILEGFNFIGCEMQPEYHGIAKARIEHAMKPDNNS